VQDHVGDQLSSGAVLCGEGEDVALRADRRTRDLLLQRLANLVLGLRIPIEVACDLRVRAHLE